MLQAFVMLAEAAHSTAEEESSKAAFYITAGILAGWAVVLSYVGLRQADFPRDAGTARAVMGISGVLTAATIVAAALTG